MYMKGGVLMMNQIEITCTKEQYKVMMSNTNRACIAGICPYNLEYCLDDNKYCPYQWKNIKVNIVKES